MGATRHSSSANQHTHLHGENVQHLELVVPAPLAYSLSTSLSESKQQNYPCKMQDQRCTGLSPEDEEGQQCV
eukprot:6485406-Amphidinium_carterae.1